MKTTSKCLALLGGVVLASSGYAASFWNSSPFGGLSPLSGMNSPFGLGVSPFSMGSPWGSGFPMMGSGFSPWSSGFPMLGSGFSPWGGGFPMLGSGLSPWSGGLSPYSALSPFSSFGNNAFAPWTSGLWSRGLNSPLPGNYSYPFSSGISPYSNPYLYGASPYSYGLPVGGVPLTPYNLQPATSGLPLLPLAY